MRGLRHHRKELRHRKLRLLLGYAKRHSATFVQEVHGTHDEILALFSRFRALFQVHISSCADGEEGDNSPNSGGLVTLLNKAHHGGWSSVGFSIVHGRLLKVVATSSTPLTHDNSGWRGRPKAGLESYNPSTFSPYPTCSYINTHNQNIPRGVLDIFFRNERHNVSRAKAHPELHQIMLAGDLNLRPPGFSSLSLNVHQRSRVNSSEIAGERLRANSQRRPLEALWNMFLFEFTEILDEEHSHVCIQNLSSSRIDRILPPFLDPSLLTPTVPLELRKLLWISSSRILVTTRLCTGNAFVWF